jgi:hypothetical protein
MENFIYDGLHIGAIYKGIICILIGICCFAAKDFLIKLAYAYGCNIKKVTRSGSLRFTAYGMLSACAGVIIHKLVVDGP